MIKVYIILVASVFVYGSNFDNEIEMVADVINSYEKPTRVLVYDCWKKRKIIFTHYKCNLI